MIRYSRAFAISHSVTWARVAALALALSSSAGLLCQAAEWPRFRGPNNDNVGAETGLLAEWPESGPPLLWQMSGLGKGFSSVSIVGNKLLTMGDDTVAKKPKENARQYIMAFDLRTRKRLWATPVGPSHDAGGQSGPRSTPTIDGNLAYAISTRGELVCLNVNTGKILWQKSFEGDFGGKMMSTWQFSESPLVDGEQVVCTPGGPQAMLVALNKRTGKTIWKCAVPKLGDRGSDGAGYSSIVAAEIAGTRQYVQNIGRGVIGVDARSGKFLWGYNRIACNIANCPSPIVRGDYVFATNSYGAGSGMVKISREGSKFKADEVWYDGAKQFENHHGGVVLVGDYLYGGSGMNNGEPTCLEFLTGKIAWQAKKPDRGSATFFAADGKLIMRWENGLIALADASPKEFRIISRFQSPTKTGPLWSYPVVCDGNLYLRDNDILYCYDLREKAP